MACHRGSHHLHGHHQPCCCCCCASSCGQSTPHPAIPGTTTATANDPLLQAIAAHLLQTPPPAVPQPTYHLYPQQQPKPQYSHPLPQHHQKYQHQQRRPQTQAEGLIQSLLSRIAALESALPHLSSPPPPPSAAKPEPPPRRPQPSSRPVPPTTPRVSIRELAARTIQVHFRLYLVRRSQALRHLKHLAAIRSHVAAIKASLPEEARLLSPEALSQKATDLLLLLDSIQSTDPMIREGKRSISRELVRLLEFADGVSARRHELVMESAEIAHKGIDPAAFVHKSAPEVEELLRASSVFGEDEDESDAGSPEMRAPTPKTAKRVTFADDGKASRVPTVAGLPFTEEDARGRGAVGRVRALVKEPRWRVGDGVGGFGRVWEHGADAHWEGDGGGGWRRSSDDEKSPRGRQKSGILGAVANGSPSGQKGSHVPGLSAPLPLQMEPRISESKKTKNVTVV